MKRNLLIVALVLLVVAGLSLFPGRLVKQYALRALHEATGFDITFGALKTDFGARTVTIQDLVIRNPPDFPDAEALEIKKLSAGFRWADLFKSGVRLQHLEIDIPRVVMVRKEDGETNFQRMEKANREKRAARSEPRSLPESANRETPPAPTPAEKPTPASPEGESSPARPPKAAPAFEIADLKLEIGKVEVRDYRRGRDGKPRVDEYEINLKSHYTDVRDLNSIASQLAGQVMIEGGIRAITKQLQDPETQDKLKKNLEKAAGDVNDFLKKMINAQEKTPASTPGP